MIGTGGDAVVTALRALGVDTVFGVASVHNLPILDAMTRQGEISVISVRHEQSAVHAADGYSRVTGRLGVAITSTGPGAANAMGGRRGEPLWCRRRPAGVRRVLVDPDGDIDGRPGRAAGGS